MISMEVTKMINDQINAEIWSSYLYLSMSLQTEAYGYRGVSNWFYVQALEELDHSRILQKYLMAQEERVRLLAVAAVPTDWPTVLDMFREAQQQEQNVTKSVTNIMLEAQRQNDFATSNMIAWFIDEQVEEERSCSLLVRKFEQAEESPSLFMQLDYELQKRRYEPSPYKWKSGESK